MEEKKFDVNSFIGMILIGGILFWWMSSNQPEIDQNTKTTTEQVIEVPKNDTNSTKGPIPVIESDSLKQANLQNQLGAFASSVINGKEGTTTLENELLLLKINNKGGQITEAVIKGYETHDSLPLHMIKDNNASFNINFGTTDNRILNTKDLFFEPSLTNNGSSQVLSMKLKVSDTQFLEYRYEMTDDYMVNFAVRSQGLSTVINSSNTINLDWSLKGYRHEKSLRTENTMYSYFYYKSDNDVDYLGVEDNDLVNNVDWVSYKQHFFSSILLTDKPFSNAAIASEDLVKDEAIDSVFTKRYSLKTPLELSNGELNYNMKWFYGPSNYKRLKAYEGTDLEETADLGWGIFGWVNRFAVIPLFNLLKDTGLGYGIIILILNYSNHSFSI